MDIFRYLNRKFCKPRDIYEANEVVLFCLKYLGALPIKYDLEKSRQINLSKRGLFISILFTIAYAVGVVDQLQFESTRESEYKYIDESILYLSLLVPFTAGFISLLVVYGSSLMSIKSMNCCFRNLFMLDSKLITKDVSLMNKRLLKVHMWIVVLSWINTVCMFTHFAIMNMKSSGLTGLIRCFLYVTPYLYVNVLLYLYISLVFMLRQRFSYIYNYLKQIFSSYKNKNSKKKINMFCQDIFLYQIKNSTKCSYQSQEQELKILLNIHGGLADLIDCINENFGFLICTCLSVMFLTDVFNIFLTIKMIGNMDTTTTGESWFLLYWLITSKTAIFYMPFENVRCIAEVSNNIK